MATIHTTDEHDDDDNADKLFRRVDFETWWQIRVLGKPYPERSCPFCGASVALTQSHLEETCGQFATQCWSSGIQPHEAFFVPPEPDWFIAILNIIDAFVAE